MTASKNYTPLSEKQVEQLKAQAAYDAGVVLGVAM